MKHIDISSQKEHSTNCPLTTSWVIVVALVVIVLLIRLFIGLY